MSDFMKMFKTFILGSMAYSSFNVGFHALNILAPHHLLVCLLYSMVIPCLVETFYIEVQFSASVILGHLLFPCYGSLYPTYAKHDPWSVLCL